MKLDIAQKFLSRFDYELTTIQVFPVLINGIARWPRKGGQYLATGDKGSTAAAFSGALKKQPFIKDLPHLQRQRMGVYFMVNEGDGEFHNSKIVRNSAAVHTLKALFVDTDEGSPGKLKGFCNQYKIKPHIIVESSPGKYHYYFLIENVAASDKTHVFHWQSCQHRLASIDPRYDDSMADLGQVLRLPGFYHTKKDPFLTKIIYESAHNHYNLDTLFKLIGAEQTPPRKGKAFERPTKLLNLGARHEALSAFLGSLSNYVQDNATLEDAGIGFAIRHFNRGRDWMPNGVRNQELRDQVHYVVREREKEAIAHSLSVVDHQTTAKGFKKLPDAFYLKAPGIVGKIVREICHYSAQPYPSFAFAAACSLVGTLKAPFIRGEYRNTPPSTYFMCLASTGRGKDFPREVIANAFIKLGLSSLLTQRFRSAQGFLKRLSKANGIHLILHDEAHHLFAQIRKADTDYITTLKPHLLSLFSAPNSPVYDVGTVVTQATEIPPIPYPTVNYCGFGVPTGFEDTFQSGELAEGLLTRFLVLRDHQPVLPIQWDDSKIPKRFKFEEPVRELASKLRLSLETKLLDDSKQPQTTVKQFVQVPIDHDAFKLIENYSKRIAEHRNNGASEVTDSLQSRLVEQVMRLAIILSDERTTKEIVQFAITFVDHCYDNIALHAGSFSKGQGNKELDDLCEFIQDRIRISKGPMQAQDLCYFRIRDRRTLNETLNLGIDLNRIKKIDNFRKAGTTKGRVSTAYLVEEST